MVEPDPLRALWPVASRCALLCSFRYPTRPARLLATAIGLAVLIASASALAAQAPPATTSPKPTSTTPKPTPTPSVQPVSTAGTLAQLPGPAGCVRDRSRGPGRCTMVRALGGPGQFLGSRAIAIDPTGRHVYVASSRGDAITILRRGARTGTLSQASTTRGCIAARGAGGCTRAVGLDGASSVAVSLDGRHVYAASPSSNAVTVFTRNSQSGALRQATGASGCISAAATRGCRTGRALGGADVVALSRDGRHVYVGAFAAGAIAVFARNASTGALTQPPGVAGCIGGAPPLGCAPALAVSGPEGLAVSNDGASVYVAAATSNAVAVLTRDAASGALTQQTDGTGCVVERPLAGCSTGKGLAGANAVAVSPDGATIYVTSLESDTVTSFARAPTGALTQLTGTSACVVFLLANGCSLGRALDAPEGLTVSPDGGEVYVAAFSAGAIVTLTRTTSSGALLQKPRRSGCLVLGAASDCRAARAVGGASSVVVSPDGRNLYATGFSSDAVGVFKRVTRGS